MFPNAMRGIKDFQEFHTWMDEQKGFGSDMNYNMILLTGEIGEVAQVLKRIHFREYLLQKESAPNPQVQAVSEYRADLGSELADCLAYIFKLANNAGIDLHEAYLAKMQRNLQRTWTAPKPPENQG